MKRVVLLAFSLLFIVAMKSQVVVDSQTDSVTYPNKYHSPCYKFSAKKLVLPSALILYGATGLFSNQWTKTNRTIQERVVNDWNNPYKENTIDNVLAFVPAISVYGLNLCGVEGMHNFRDRTVILGVSGVITLVAVEGLKMATHNLRPDGSTYDSWPSGHTALAFAGAEFMYQEFREKSVWYGVSAYAVATSVAALRVYNNRHWFTDVAAGAGFGILGTKISYWLFPLVADKLLTNKPLERSLSARCFLTPSIIQNRIGFELLVTL